MVGKLQMETARDFLMNEVCGKNSSQVIEEKLAEMGLNMGELFEVATDATIALAQLNEGEPDAVAIVSFFVAAYLVGFMNGQSNV